jgi:peptide deformylase
MNFQLGAHESLVMRSDPWDFNIDQNAEELERAMCDFMTANHGIGLAANQKGIGPGIYLGIGLQYSPKFLQFGK